MLILLLFYLAVSLFISFDRSCLIVAQFVIEEYDESRCLSCSRSRSRSLSSSLPHLCIYTFQLKILLIYYKEDIFYQFFM